MNFGMSLPGRQAFPICASGSRRTALSPTWSGPEGSSHNDFVPGRRLPPFPASELVQPLSQLEAGVAMTDFEFLFSVFGLLIGLTFIEIAIKFADAIDAHSRRPIGVLTPLLALFVMVDVAGYWLFSWSIRELLHVRWRIVFVGLTVALIYYLSASMIFPRSEGEWKNLDDHYWARKRLVIGGILLVEGATMAWQLTRAVPALDDYWFWFYQLPYYIPMGALLFTRSRRVDIALFVILIGVQLFSDFDLGPSSRWGQQVGISLIPVDQASTVAPAALK
jgi:hypothetical protein